MGSPDSHGIPRVPWYLGYLRKSDQFRLRVCHPLWPTFPGHSTNTKFCNSSAINSTSLPRNPQHINMLSLVFSAFDRLYWRNACLFIFHLVLKCFTSQGTLPASSAESSRFARWGFPIRTSSDQRLLGTSPKRIAAKLRPSSLLWSQGIHHMLLNFLLGNLKTAILLYSVTWNHITECFLPAHLHNPLKDPCGFDAAKWKAWWNLFIKNLVRADWPVTRAREQKTAGFKRFSSNNQRDVTYAA